MSISWNAGAEMEEKGVFWMPSRKSGAAENEAANDEELQAAIRRICEAAGFDSGDFLAAAGAYGSWLIRLTRAGDEHRVVWNGKEGRMVLEASRGQAGWEELGTCAPGESDPAGLAAGLESLLDSASGSA